MGTGLGHNFPYCVAAKFSLAAAAATPTTNGSTVRTLVVFGIGTFATAA